MLSRAPDAVEPMLGWRVWSVVETDDGLRLASLVYRMVWEPGQETEARCRRALAQLPWARMPLHEPPNADCRCGIYGVSSLELAFPYLDSPLEHGGRSVRRVIGRVQLWGRVVEGAWGWRAAAGYPAAVYLPPRSGWRPRRPFARSEAHIAAALEEYGVPVAPLERALAGA